jgi:hypothetical protein
MEVFVVTWALKAELCFVLLVLIGIFDFWISAPKIDILQNLNVETQRI